MLSDRDRLIELLKQAQDNYCDVCAEDLGYKDHEPFENYFADHLIENGVILPPCKVGDIVYTKYSGTNEIEYYVVDEVVHLGSDNFDFKAHLENEDGYVVDNIEFSVPEIGLTVFLTEEESEKALERSNDNA